MQITRGERNVLKEIVKLIKPEKKLQKDVFEWFEKGIWMAEAIKCKSSNKLIYVDSYFCEETDKFYIEYYIK